MRIKKIIPFALLALCLSCTRFDDDLNVTGSGFARSKDVPRTNFGSVRNVAPDSGLASAASIVDSSRWDAVSVCRTGIWENDTFVACLNFHIASVPSGIDSLNGRFSTDSMRINSGIDSIKLDFYILNGSLPSGNIAGNGGVTLFAYKKLNSGITNLVNLGRFNFDPAVIIAPADSGKITFSVRNGSNSAAYRYLVDSMFVNRRADSLSVPLALLQDSAGALLSFNPSRKPVLTYYGRSVKRLRAATPDTNVVAYQDTVVRDSVVVGARVMKTVAFMQPSKKALLDSVPSVTTFETRMDNAAGKYRAKFDVSVSEILSGLNPDSTVMLRGDARFFTIASPDTSLSESRQSVDFLLYCHFLDSAGERVPVSGSGVYRVSDTVAVYGAFEPWSDTTFSVSIGKQLVAITDPLFAHVRTLRFIVAAADRTERSSLDRLAKVSFRKKLTIDYSYEKR